MKKIVSVISAAACMAAFTAMPANAEGSEKVYGTMNIPYAIFIRLKLKVPMRWMLFRPQLRKSGR